MKKVCVFDCPPGMYYEWLPHSCIKYVRKVRNNSNKFHAIRYTRWLDGLIYTEKTVCSLCFLVPLGVNYNPYKQLF
ncbi:hypothetical protein [Capybara microvirus Cap1_SP_115]|nr:hypothetical protein [Capybara microvirus Cap1_SP_115]